MFIDNPTIPAQLEVLLEVIHAMRDRKADVGALKLLIQPKGLPGLSNSSEHLELHVKAARELGLVQQDSDKNIRLVDRLRGSFDAKKSILKAFDKLVLSRTDVEKWAARFYAYLIVQEVDVGPDSSAKQELLAKDFMERLPPSIGTENAMNRTKYGGLIRWYCYAGLGWIDPSGRFVPDPTIRVRRALPEIWGAKKKLDIDEFMMRLAEACPELDGGVIFEEVTVGQYNATNREFTRAVGTALWRLHEEEDLRLICPKDSMGWRLDRAGKDLVKGEASNKVSQIERKQGVEA
jgi:hypothetical protein